MPIADASSVPPQSTRREFVKTSTGLLAGGALLSATMPLTRAAYAGGDEEIKIALIGCGGRGKMAAAQALNTPGKVKLWALADAFPNPQPGESEGQLAGALARIRRDLTDLRDGANVDEQFDVPPERQFVGLDAFQKAIDSGVDLIVHATPPGFRPQHIEAAIQAGKHVFTEKPLAVDAPGVRRVLAAGELAKEKGLAVGVGLQRHHDPGYVETVRRIHDGAIGEVLLTRVYWNSPPIWVRTRSNYAESYGAEPNELEYQVNNWYYFNWLCGDHIVEQHIHNIDVSNWVKKAHPVSARGMGGRLRRSREEGQIFDQHFVEFTYADGSTMMSQCRHQQGCWNEVGEVACGVKGTSELNNKSIRVGSEIWKYNTAAKKVDPFQQEHVDLFAAIRNGTPYNELEYGAHSTMTTILGRMATYSGQEIAWDDAIASNLRLAPDLASFADAAPLAPQEDGGYPIPIPGLTKVI